MRLFLAIPLPPELQRRLEQVQEELSSMDWQVRRTPPDQLHLTLHFLGDTPESLLPDLHHELSAIAHARRPFDLSCGGLGAFPSWEDPRVLWAGVSDHGGKLEELFEASYRVLNAYRMFKSRREFTPHLTLGRVDDLKATWDQKRLLALMPQWDKLGRLGVEEFRLMRSHLEPKGARHEVVEIFKLGPVQHVL